MLNEEYDLREPDILWVTLVNTVEMVQGSLVITKQNNTNTKEHTKTKIYGQENYSN